MNEIKGCRVAERLRSQSLLITRGHGPKPHYSARMSEQFKGLACILPSLLARMFVTMRRGLAQQIHLLNVARGSPKHVRVAFASLPSRYKKSAVQARAQSSTSTSHDEPHAARSWLLRRSSIRVSTLFTALLALGAGATALGLCVACHTSRSLH